MVEAALFLLVAGGGIWFTVEQNRRRLLAWTDAAESCGLHVVESTLILSPWLKARAGLVTVQISGSGDKGRATRIVVHAPGPEDFRNLKIRPESPVRLAREIEVGDKNFDDTFVIEGPAHLVSALLDAETRRLMLKVQSESRLEIVSDKVEAVMSGIEKIHSLLPLLLEIRQRIAEPLNVARRLAESAHKDPEPGVRLHNLLLLARGLPGHPETLDALHNACSDPRPEIRLRAAKELGAEARGVLLELAEGIEDDAVSAQALSILAGELPFERAIAILNQALRRRRLQTAGACLEAIGRGKTAAAVDLLVKVMEREGDELAPAAARALGATGSPAAEPPLIQALQREEEGLQLAAANALGLVGSVAAVLPLKELADRFLLGETRRAARQAVAEIQSRVQGASPGQLSLAGAEAGQLSLATDSAGQLSLPAKEPGRLSLSEDEGGGR
jgi:HEAT repeat protein